MQFTKRLRDPIKNGEITRTVRVWKSPRVKIGNAYKMDEGHVVVESIHEIEFDDISPSLARETGFSSVAELIKVAKHGSGEIVYLVSFRYEEN